MNQKYIVKLLPDEGCSEEYAPDTIGQEGIHVDGYLVIGFKDDKPYCDTLMGANTLTLARTLAYEKTETVNTLWQAVAIAEGLKKAHEIKKNFDKPEIPFGSISGTITGSGADKLKEFLFGEIFGNGDEE